MTRNVRAEAKRAGLLSSGFYAGSPCAARALLNGAGRWQLRAGPVWVRSAPQAREEWRPGGERPRARGCGAPAGRGARFPPGRTLRRLVVFAGSP